MGSVSQALKWIGIVFLGVVVLGTLMGMLLLGELSVFITIGMVAAFAWVVVKFVSKGKAAQQQAQQAQTEQLLTQIDAEYNTASANDILYSQPADLLEERVVDRQYVGGSVGVRFRVMKGVSVGVGQQRGRMVAQTGITSVSSGTISLTKDRVIFAGNKKSVTIPLTKVLGVSAYANAFDISVDNANTRMFMVRGPLAKNAEFAEVLEHIRAKI